MTPTVEHFVLKALTVPFEDRGRGWTGWDCWGLVRTAYRDILGVDLPSYATQYENTVDLFQLKTVIDRHRDGWQKVDKPKSMDVALLTYGGRPVHVGLMIGSDYFLNAEKRVGTYLDRLSSVEWKKRVEGVYRLG